MANDQFKVHLGNLSFKTVKETLETVFAPCGAILEISLPIDRETGKSRGFAFITFDSAPAQKNAIEKNGLKIDGRIIKVSEARPSTQGPRNNTRRPYQPSYHQDSQDIEEFNA
jgi:RNA recognition motif-containing protein